MSEHRAHVAWERDGAAFTDARYSRAHRWTFDGGVIVPASSSPHVVPLPYSAAAAVDPEEAFVAALSSCHMLWFLTLAAGRGFVVDAYEDEAVGVLGPDASGRTVVSHVVLRPRVRCGTGPVPSWAVHAQNGKGREPTRLELDALHEAAHAACFLANSVRCEIRCEPRA